MAGLVGRFAPLLALLASAVLPAGLAYAGDLDVHGYLLGAAAGRASGRSHPATDDSALASEARLRVELDAWNEAGDVHSLVRAEFIADGIAGADRTELREAYSEVEAAGGWLRAGRQVHTWGSGDLLFVSDVFPKDWHAWFTGLPQDYLKLGVDGLSWSGRALDLDADLVVAPRFRPDQGPDPMRFTPWDPFGGAARTRTEPPADVQDPWVAARLVRPVGSWTLAAVAARTRWGLPASRPVAGGVQESYPRLGVYSLALTGALGNSVVWAEGGWYQSRDDRDGRDPWTPNSQARGLLGLQRQLGEDAFLTLQAYAEVRERQSAYERSLPAGTEPAERARPVAMARYTLYLDHRTWTLEGLGFWDPDAGDSLVVAQAVRALGDAAEAGLSARVFGGPRATPFGALDRDDNLALWLRVHF